MKLFDVLKLNDPSIDPSSAKLHLAGWNGTDDPLDVFRHGKFQDWQAWQRSRNFERPQIVSLIQMRGGGQRWLFAGCFDQHGCSQHPTHPKDVLYQTTERTSTESLSGRLIVQYQRQGRQPYRYAETVADALLVVELRDKRVSAHVFTDYSEVRLSKKDLDLIVAHQNDAWVDALSSVRGIYVITDTSNGKLYVGSALANTRRGGRGGIWERWCDYAKNGHGGDVDLVRVITEKGADHVQRYFQYSILEIAGSSATEDDVKIREGHWKRVLGTYDHGYNRNVEADVDHQV
jgi:hypothetical protein